MSDSNEEWRKLVAAEQQATQARNAAAQELGLRGQGPLAPATPPAPAPVKS